MNTSRCLATAVLVALLLACGKKQQTPGGQTTGGSASAADASAPDDAASGGTVAETSSAAAAAGGPSTQGGLDSGNSSGAPASCEALAELACSKQATCAPFYLSGYGHGTQTQCVDAVRGACEYYNASNRPLDFQGCANALSAANCQALLTSPELPKVCLKPRGSKAAGSACGTDAECQSLLCDKKDACGTCIARGARGASCAAGENCEPGLRCDGSTCVETVGLGKPCNTTNLLCAAYSTCVGDTCQAQGEAGASCDLLTPCNTAKGLICSGNTCVSVGLLSAGETCGKLGPTACKGGLYCSGAITNKVCAPRAALGADCSVTPCATSLTCLNGICVYEELTTCSGS